ncbi:hypothetical protein M0D69_12940 [Caballeronia sp. SEWSISQ10-4 2]|uniref:hypothetical protein n=1 Tax=Caballeronia sp. SEWSISQ10-4 2 TaxID=2937438 RepID=UPI002654E204|nr:hypothetical protein [Caballeronia sp. SEWSISQ10-4 2]MDN7178903.1 hypothetical protein [Caballeronia sp. SEWSISQ10-4 2]
MKSSTIARTQKPMNISSPFQAGARRPAFSVADQQGRCQQEKIEDQRKPGEIHHTPLGSLGSGRKEPSVVISRELNERIGAIFTRAVT